MDSEIQGTWRSTLVMELIFIDMSYYSAHIIVVVIIITYR